VHFAHIPQVIFVWAAHSHTISRPTFSRHPAELWAAQSRKSIRYNLIRRFEPDGDRNKSHETRYTRTVQRRSTKN